VKIYDRDVTMKTTMTDSNLAKKYTMMMGTWEKVQVSLGMDGVWMGTHGPWGYGFKT
jgi:hypothetical protein